MSKFFKFLILIVILAVLYTTFFGTSPAKSSSDNSSNKPLVTTVTGIGSSDVQSVVRVGEAGYKTIEDVTYFFVKYQLLDTESQGVCSGKDYGDYVCVFRYSYSLSGFNNITDGEFTLGRAGSVYGEYVYVSYCSVQNCENPDAVLDDLNKNVFSNEKYYSVEIYSGLGDEVIEGAS